VTIQSREEGAAGQGPAAAKGGADGSAAIPAVGVSSGDAAKKKRAKPIGSARPVNRARQLKMAEVMSDAALLRWEAMEEYERRMMVQVCVCACVCVCVVPLCKEMNVGVKNKAFIKGEDGAGNSLFHTSNSLCQGTHTRV